MTNTDSLASRIVYLRNDILHMTQSEFCSALKISQTYLSLIKAGKKNITKTIISNILTTFNVNADWLLSGIGSDQDIFLDNELPKIYLPVANSESVLNELQKLCSLSNDETSFISWFVSLPAKDRAQFISSVETFSALVRSYPPRSS